MSVSPFFVQQINQNDDNYVPTNSKTKNYPFNIPSLTKEIYNLYTQ
jgi:hypothetical protein